jgi:hypothetical protein
MALLRDWESRLPGFLRPPALLDHRPDHSERVVTPRLALFFLAAAALLVPWTVTFFLTLPHREDAARWHIAWGGFDTLLIVVFVSAGIRILRLSPAGALAMASASALLITDAWFDVMTAPTTRDLGPGPCDGGTGRAAHGRRLHPSGLAYHRSVQPGQTLPPGGRIHRPPRQAGAAARLAGPHRTLPGAAGPAGVLTRRAGGTSHDSPSFVTETGSRPPRSWIRRPQAGPRPPVAAGESWRGTWLGRARGVSGNT